MLDFIQQMFNTFLNMSITGACIILAVIIIRLLIRKAPKIFSYILWAIPALRLILPFSFSSVFSIFNLFSAPTQSTAIEGISTQSFISESITETVIPEISTDYTDGIVNGMPSGNITPLIDPMRIISAVWIIGIICMLIYAIVSFVKIKKLTEFATKLDGNVFECEKVASPFAIGVFKPKIYLPCGMDEKSRDYVIRHEKAHLNRFDHIIKLTAFIILAFHWYNPLVWIAFKLMTRDMEMSCDEKVLASLDTHEKKEYGLTLVKIGSSKRFFAAAPLSFGENGIEERVVNIIKFKKPRVIAIVLCVILCIIAGITFLTNNKVGNNKYTEYENIAEAHVEYQRDVVAGIEIVDMKDDGTAYAWMQTRSFGYSYSDWLDGTAEYNLNGVEALIKEAFRSKDPFETEPDAKLFEVKIKFNDSLVVTELESLRGEAPVDMGNEEEYAEIIWNKIIKKSKEKLKNAYGGKYELANAQLTINPTEHSDYLHPIAFELVEYMGNPVMVMKITNSMPAADDIPVPLYVFDGKAEIRMYEENGVISFIEPEGRTEIYGNRYSIPGGADAGREQLCIYDLSPLGETPSPVSPNSGSLSEAYEYVIVIKVYTPDGKQADAFLRFRINSNILSDEKPELTYESLTAVNEAKITEKISAPLYGSISKGYNNPVSFVLSDSQMKTISKLFNSANIKEDFGNYEEVNPDTFCYIRITDKNLKNHSFAVSLAWILDSQGNKYTAENAELFKTVAEIYDDILSSNTTLTTTRPYFPEHDPSTTAAPERDENAPAITKPPIA